MTGAETTMHAIRDCLVANAVWQSQDLSGDDKVRLSNSGREWVAVA